MPEHAAKKMLLNAWVDESIVASVDAWLENRPTMNRSAFLASAVANKLALSGIHLPSDLTEHYLRVRNRDASVPSSTLRPGSRTKPVKPRQGVRVRTEKSRNNKINLGAFVDPRLFGGVEEWLNLNSRENRASFVVAAVSEELGRGGVKLRPALIGAKPPRRSLPRLAYEGVQLNQWALLKKMHESAVNMQMLLKKFEACKNLEQSSQRLARLRRQIVKRLNLINSGLGGDVVSAKMSLHLDRVREEKFSTALEIRPTVSGNAPHLRSLGLAIQKALIDRGAKCITLFHDNQLTLILQELRAPTLWELVQNYSDALQRGGWSLEFVQRSKLPVTFKELPEVYLGRNSLIRQNLTKLLLFGLDAGAYVVSNCCSTEGRTIFGVQVDQEEVTREKLWKLAQEKGAAGRVVDVYWTEAEFKAACEGGFGSMVP